MKIQIPQKLGLAPKILKYYIGIRFLFVYFLSALMAWEGNSYNA